MTTETLSAIGTVETRIGAVVRFLGVNSQGGRIATHGVIVGQSGAWLKVTPGIPETLADAKWLARTGRSSEWHYSHVALTGQVVR